MASAHAWGLKTPPGCDSCATGTCPVHPFPGCAVQASWINGGALLDALKRGTSLFPAAPGPWSFQAMEPKFAVPRHVLDASMRRHTFIDRSE